MSRQSAFSMGLKSRLYGGRKRRVAPAASILSFTAARLGSARIVVGTSPRLTISEQGMGVGAEWEKLPEPRPALLLEVVPDDSSKSVFFNLGPHPPRLWPQDLDLLHALWRDLSDAGPKHKLHHRDVVGLALHRLRQQLSGPERKEILAQLQVQTESESEDLKLVTSGDGSDYR